MKLSFDPKHWHNDQQPKPAILQQPDSPAVVFEDADLLVVEKPAGLPVQPDQAGSANLLDLFSQLTGKGLFLVHRLDRPVFGLVVLAKSAQVQTALTRQMAQGIFIKKYRAVVENGPAEDLGKLQDLLVKQERQNISAVVDRQSSSSRAREARLNYTVIERANIDGKQLCLMEITLETGRHHQIRVQLAHAGWPIVGDHKYNAGSIWGKHPIALQACEISLQHPSSHETLDFRASNPVHWPWNQFDSSHMNCARQDKL